MRKYNLFCPIRAANPYRRMAKALRTNAVADNLLKREFKLHGPRKILLTDITYIKLKESFVYLSVIIDAFTKEVLSYELSDSLELDFVLKTVKNLHNCHKLSDDVITYIHSDQGCHYTSVLFRQLLEDYGIRQSMSRRGNCWDNAPQESFFGHMKDEVKKYTKYWKSFDDVKARIDDWMNYYNEDRSQMDLLDMSPAEYSKCLDQGLISIEKEIQRHAEQ